VRYRVRGPLREILVCHCHECRRWAGRAWAATAARAADLDVAGEVRWRLSSSSQRGAERGSCPACGASLFWHPPGSELVSVGAGTLDEPSGLRVAAHVWVEQAADWERPAEGMPVFPRGYPADAPALRWG
jgi:hypothetical protein